MPHYYDDQPQAASRPGEVRLAVRGTGRTLALATDRGVFSGSRVDPGTAVLLDHGPAPPAEGDVLDLGCGYGPIALSLAVRSPAASVWAVDVNERARALCRANAAAHGLGNVTVAAPDELPDDVRFDAIWSNPPVRIGRAPLLELLDRWLDRLVPGGRAVLVVQRHLGSDSLAERLGATRLRSKQGYRILEVRR